MRWLFMAGLAVGLLATQGCGQDASALPRPPTGLTAAGDMGLAWHESGWQPSVVSSAGAVGMMQVMPATADADGPALLHRTVNLFDPADNIDMGTAILKNNLDRYHDDIAKALTAYYAGGSAVADWANLRADCRRYVWAVYNAAMMFKEGRGPA
jgi:soluble lytic murein transglycosylase-like protein